MLRTKRLGTLSQSARSFFFSGSRCNAADGSSSCTCTEDETCVSRKQNPRNEVQHGPAPPTLASARAGSLNSGDAVKVVNSHKPESVKHHASLPQVISATSSLGRSDCVSYASSIDNIQSGSVHSLSPPISDQFVKVGIAPVSFLSDLVNYKIPSSSKNSMVDGTRPVSNIKSANVKTYKKDKVRGKPSAQSAPGSNLTIVYSHGAKGRGEKPGLVKGSNTVPNNGPRNSVETHGVSSDSRVSKRVLPQRSNGHSIRALSTAQTSEGKFRGETAKIPTGVAPMARQFSSTGHVVETVSRILRQLKWGPATEEALRKLNCSMDVHQANHVLKQLQGYSIALGFFYWLKRRTGFKHDGHTYTTMIGILGCARQFGTINKLLDQIIRDGCQPNVVTYNRLIHSYGRANYLNEVVNVFKQMQELGCEPDRVTYCTLIDVHAKAGYLDFAIYVLVYLRSTG